MDQKQKRPKKRGEIPVSLLSFPSHWQSQDFALKRKKRRKGKFLFVHKSNQRKVRAIGPRIIWNFIPPSQQLRKQQIFMLLSQTQNIESWVAVIKITKPVVCLALRKAPPNQAAMLNKPGMERTAGKLIWQLATWLHVRCLKGRWDLWLLGKSRVSWVPIKSS